MPCQFQCQCGLTKGSKYWLRKVYLKGKSLWRHRSYYVDVYWLASFSPAWKVTNGEERLLAFQFERLMLFKLPEMLCITVGKRKGEGRKSEAQVPTVHNGTGIPTQPPGTKMSFILLCFKPYHSQIVKGSIAIMKIFSSWYQPIKMEYGCYALWVCPGQISAGLQL